MNNLTKHILIVEDEVLVAWSLENILKKSGYRVTITDTAEKALDLVRTTVYNLIITDFKLPKINGFELASTVRASSDPLPIIMISGDQDPNYQSTYPNNSITRFIEKPFDIVDVLKTVDTLLAGNATFPHTA
jgi:DNA-binding response OmpR family regulator